MARRVDEGGSKKIPGYKWQQTPRLPVTRAGASANPSLPGWLRDTVNRYRAGAQGALGLVRQGGQALSRGTQQLAASARSNKAIPKWVTQTSPQQRGKDVVNAAKGIGGTIAKWLQPQPYSAEQQARMANPRYRGVGGPPIIPTADEIYRASLPDYAKGPNWTRGEYVEPPNFPFENPELRMLPSEYINRRGAFIRTYGVNPFQTEQERILRQNVAPAGTIYTPFAYWMEKPTLPEQPAPQPQQTGGGGGWPEDWGWGGGGGGGGGGGWDYGAALKEFYNRMTQWTIGNTNRGG